MTSSGTPSTQPCCDKYSSSALFCPFLHLSITTRSHLTTPHLTRNLALILTNYIRVLNTRHSTVMRFAISAAVLLTAISGCAAQVQHDTSGVVSTFYFQKCSIDQCSSTYLLLRSTVHSTHQVGSRGGRRHEVLWQRIAWLYRQSPSARRRQA